MTRKFFLIAGVAAVALTSPVNAERRGHDRESRAQSSQSGGERKAQRNQRAERPQRAERQSFQRAERPQRAERQRTQRAERSQRVERQRMQRAERPQRVERQKVQRAERSQRIDRQRVQRAERTQRVERQQRNERADRGQRIERQHVQQAERRNAERLDRRSVERLDRRQDIARQDRNTVERVVIRDNQRQLPARFVARDDRQFARMFNDRPMRAMKIKDDRRIIAIGDRIDPARYSSTIPTVYRSRYYDTPDYYYRYDDDLGYLYRIDRDDDYVRAMIPLFGGYGIGDPWPNTYYSSYVPVGYRSLYYDTPDYYYRTDGYGIYRVNAGTQLIAGLVALLSGQGFGVGQMLPASYGAYNVPMAYRSTYYDRNDAWYRYGDGFIYRVDPYSRRIDARYPLYGAGYDYTIGQPWPVAYPGYNVPLAYQPLYADTPQYQYRYANGGIYQVDPYSRRIDARYPLYGGGYDYAIGQPWPVAYPGYNVPLAYQPLYADSPQYQYRYANGGIYQVDPTTQVIQALVALVSGQPMAIGQPLPAGYGTYNVPLAYRDRYYDTNDAWYRYADGYVYQVDPGTGLIAETYPIYA